MNKPLLTVIDYLNSPINVYGNYKELLFEPNQVSGILNIKNVGSIIENFDDDEYVNELLTEHGLYRLCQSNNEFQRWARDAIKKLRSNCQKTYEPIVKTGYIYILKTDAKLAYKLGITKDTVDKRVKHMQYGVLDDIEILFMFKTGNPQFLKTLVADILKRYRCNARRDFYECNLNYIKFIITTCGNFIDTLRSTYENITPNELYSRLKENNIDLHNVDGAI
jgi:hypothetical protein